MYFESDCTEIMYVLTRGSELFVWVLEIYKYNFDQSGCFVTSEITADPPSRSFTEYIRGTEWSHSI